MVTAISPTLVVDVYEPPEMREKLSDITMDVTDLTDMGGDYIWFSEKNQAWAIERKSISDFVGSYYSGRLTSQLRMMLENYDQTVLLVEGVPQQNMDGNILTTERGHSLRNHNMKYALYQDILLEAQMTGVKIQQSTSKMDSAKQVRRLYYWSSRVDHSLLNRPRKIGLEFGTRLDNRTRFLCGLPGIGPEVAKQLIEAFRTPYMAMSMFQNDNGAPYLDKIKGLGSGKISAVRKVLFE